MNTLNWKLEGIPAYTDGELFDELFKLGGGLYDESLEATSLMHLINNTSSSAFLAYCGELEAAGFVGGFARETDAGIFREYIAEGKLVYTYYMKRVNQARVIYDNCSATYAEFAAEDASEAVRDDTELMQFGLFQGDPPIRDRVSTCGMLYVVRTHNNKLFLVDGGEDAQCTDEAFAELMLRLRELTGTTDGETITIACWFCTHAHNDHMDLFINFMAKHRDVIKVERVLYNFPDVENLDIPPEYYERFIEHYWNDRMKRLRAYCKGARFMKAHTGQIFHFDNLTVDILDTQEDMIYEQTENGAHLRGLNTTSTVTKLSFDGSTCLMLGDADEVNGDVLVRYYSADELSCTYLQAAHHLANRNENIYSYAKAETVLIPQSRLRTHKVRREHYGILCKYYDRDRFYLAADYTVIFRVKDGAEEVTYHQLQGGPFNPEKDSHNLARLVSAYEFED
ncbi:MAG: hypothetical protein IKZ22_09155 [Kiritimatiellae bacterium]|nr:hypothetical protein [Kiritimatiellia bacterium]